jgi:cytochrome c oxidase subunit II
VEEVDAVKNPIVISLIALVSMVAAVPLCSQETPRSAETKEIAITAKKYQFSPDTVEVEAGTRIIFKITALDREHGFEIAGAKTGCTKIKKGETAVVEYTAESAGTVEFKCCVFCGFGHRGMKGKIVIH